MSQMALEDRDDANGEQEQHESPGPDKSMHQLTQDQLSPAINAASPAASQPISGAISHADSQRGAKHREPWADMTALKEKALRFFPFHSRDPWTQQH